MSKLKSASFFRQVMLILVAIILLILTTYSPSAFVHYVAVFTAGAAFCLAYCIGNS